MLATNPYRTVTEYFPIKTAFVKSWGWNDEAELKADDSSAMVSVDYSGY